MEKPAQKARAAPANAETVPASHIKTNRFGSPPLWVKKGTIGQCLSYTGWLSHSRPSWSKKYPTIQYRWDCSRVSW